jgi:hypothetical protein
MIHEYLCDYCDSSFSSPLLVQNHKKKSCLGVTHVPDPENEKKKRDYMSYIHSIHSCIHSIHIPITCVSSITEDDKDEKCTIDDTIMCRSCLKKVL